MTEHKYCSLHTHSHNSFLDSCNREEDLVKQAVEVGMPAIAVTDHGNCHSFIKMYEECQKHGITFVPGQEFYFTHDHDVKDRKSRHLTVLAKDNKGLESLYRLTTLANTPAANGGGFFYRPRISWRDLEKISEGLLVLSGCMNSPINHEFGQNEDYEQGKEYAKRMMQIFGKNFFIELQNVNEEDQIFIPEQEIILEWSRKLSKDLGVPCVATNDAHYLVRDDSFAHEVLKAIDARATLDTPVLDHRSPQKGATRIVFSGFDYYVRPDEEMRKKFTDEEIEMSHRIAEMVNVSIPLKADHMPKFDPTMDDGEVYELLLQKLRDGWRKHGINDKPNKAEYEERIKVELKDIRDARNQHYFMIVWDLIDFARREGIPTGFGRGSVGGSLVAYLLGITQGVDPIKYNLIWERFWNRGRVGSPPDIDLDFPIDKRDVAIQYLKSKFGEDKVYPMMTITTMSTKQAIKDVGKVLGLPFEYMNELTKHVPHKAKSIDDAVKRSEYLRHCDEEGVDDDVRKWQGEWKKASASKKREIEAQAVDRKKTLKKTFEIARRLENIARQRSKHACALLISDESIEGKIPMLWDAKDKVHLTGFDMYDLEKLGYLKLDILGLKTLSVVSRILPNGLQDILDHGFEDPKVCALVASGNTKGIFQLEKHLGRHWCKKVRPESLEDIADVMSLIRPAVLEAGLADEYVKNREAGSWEYIHQDLAPILDSTCGIMLYQEQAIQIAKTFAGFTLERADNLRKVLGKKLEDELPKFKSEFIEGVIERYDDEGLGEELWGWLEYGAGYGFNKSHAIAYAMMAYTTAYCKLYHTAEFFAVMLQLSSNEQKPQEEISELFYDANLFGVEILPPSLQRMNSDFELIEGKIYYGLQHIKSVGPTSLKKMADLDIERFADLLSNRKGVKSDVLQALILSGALDYLEVDRLIMKAQMEFLDSLTPKELELFFCIFYDRKFVKKFRAKEDQEIDVGNAEQNFTKAVMLLEDFVQEKNAEFKIIKPARGPIICRAVNILNQFQPADLSAKQLAGYESYYLGIPATCSEADLYADSRKTHDLIDIQKEVDNKRVGTIGVVQKVILKKDKRGRSMAFVGVLDSTYMMDVIVFNQCFEEHNESLEVGRALYIEGVKRKGSVLVESIEAL